MLVEITEAKKTLNSCRAQNLQRRSHQIHRSGNHDYAVSRCLALREGQRIAQISLDEDLAPRPMRERGNVIGSSSAQILNFGGNHLIGYRKEDLRHLLDVFVAHCAEDQHERTSLTTLRDG